LGPGKICFSQWERTGGFLLEQINHCRELGSLGPGKILFFTVGEDWRFFTKTVQSLHRTWKLGTRKNSVLPSGRGLEVFY
jgi:hypothetical protein